MKYFAIITTCLFSFSAQAYDYKVIRIVDGDTIVFQADFLPPPLKPQLSLRIYGVDTPEKGSRSQCDLENKKSQLATNFVRTLIHNAKSTDISILQWDKYGGRVLGDIMIDGKSLRALLIRNGFAREYFGDKKESWCD